MADIATDAGVYAIACDQTGVVYIGETSRAFAKRWEQHLFALERGVHHCKLLQADWTQRGSMAFSFQVLEVHNEWGPKSHIEARWLKEIEDFTACYNSDPRRWRGVPRVGKGQRRG